MILTTIDGIPLFSSLEEALQWGADRGLIGSHTHTFNGEVGYMGGATHNNATTQFSSSVTTSTNTSSSRVSGGGGSSGGSSGGGGGY
tara:strand:+ start:459 stop:719 length:261 start_codon:yes stop_codon:yes gene_type:complete